MTKEKIKKEILSEQEADKSKFAEFNVKLTALLEEYGYNLTAKLEPTLNAITAVPTITKRQISNESK